MTQTTDSRKPVRAAAARISNRPIVGPAPVELPTVPAQAGSWRLAGLLGEGALARVYAAAPVDSPANRPAAYALKLLRPHLSDSAEATALMRREALVGRLVADPHLVAILAAHVLEPPYFIVMPRLAGESLAALLQRENRLNVLRALWIARQTAEGLEALHERDFLHGDIKPSNIQIAPTGHVTLLDLSFARPIRDDSSLVSQSLMGTLNYLAPEQLGSTLRSDQRTDIYSLGATFYEMLVGEPPFVAHDLAELLQMHRQERPKPLRTMRSDIPSPVAKLVGDMIAKEPLRRPQSMGEVIRALVRLEITETARADNGLTPIEFQPL